jgi:hypothetical protein
MSAFIVIFTFTLIILVFIKGDTLSSIVTGTRLTSFIFTSRSPVIWRTQAQVAFYNITVCNAGSHVDARIAFTHIDFTICTHIAFWTATKKSVRSAEATTSISALDIQTVILTRRWCKSSRLAKCTSETRHAIARKETPRDLNARGLIEARP